MKRVINILNTHLILIGVLILSNNQIAIAQDVVPAASYCISDGPQAFQIFSPPNKTWGCDFPGLIVNDNAEIGACTFTPSGYVGVLPVTFDITYQNPNYSAGDPTPLPIVGAHQTFTVTITTPPTLSSAATNTICSGALQNYTINTSAGGNSDWTRAVVAGISEGASSGINLINETLTNTTAAAIDVVYEIIPQLGCQATLTYTVTVDPAPNVTSAAAGNICSGLPQTYTITSDIGGTTYAWSRAADPDIAEGATAGASSIISETLTNTSLFPVVVDYDIVPTVGSCDGFTFTYSLTVNPNPVVSIAGLDYIDPNPTPPRWYCDDDGIDALTGSPAGGVFSGLGIENVNVVAGTADFNTATTGLGLMDITYTYTDGNGCTSPITETTRVGTQVFINGLGSNFCENDAVDAFSYTPVDVFPASDAFGNGITDLGGGNAEFDPSDAAVVTGTNTITYQYTDPEGCVNEITQDVTVSAVPVADFSNLNSPYCENDADVTLTGNIPLSGTFTGDGISNILGTGTATFSPSSLAAGGGPYSVTYTYTTGLGCTDDETKPVTINTAPTIYNVNGGGAYCDNAAAPGILVGLGNSDAGVSYELLRNGIPTGITIVPVLPGAFNFGLQVAAGTYTVVATSIGCSKTMNGNAPVSISNAPTVTIGPAQNMCLGAGATLTSSAVGGSGTYSFAWSDGSIVQNPVVNPAILGVNNYTVTVTDLVNTCTETAATSIDVKANPTVDAGVTVTSCNGDAITLTATDLTVAPAAPVTYSWEGGAYVASADYNVSPTNVVPGSAAQVYNYTVVIQDANTCTGTDNVNVSVNPNPTVDLSTADPTTICQSESITLAMDFTGTGDWDYTLSDGTFGSTSSDPFSLALTPGADITYTVSALNDANGCIAQSAEMTGSVAVTVNERPTANISGDNTICVGENSTISIALTGATPWNITYTDGTPVAVGTATTPYNYIVSPATSKTHTLLVLSDANCIAQAGDLTGSAAITVNPLPTLFSVTGTGTYCEGGAGLAIGLDNSTTGVNYELFYEGIATGNVENGFTGSSISFVPPQTAAGSYTIEATVVAPATLCSQFMTGSAVVTIDPLPAAATPIVGNSPVCQASSENYSVAAIANATFYTWDVSGIPGASITAGLGTNSITVFFSALATSGNIKVKGGNVCGAGAETSSAITVNPLPSDAVTAGVIGGNNNVCINTNEIYTIGVITNANTYFWTVPAGVNITSGQGTQSITINYAVGSTSGDITVAGVNLCGTGVSTTLAVTVNALPITTISPDATICNGETATLTATGGTNYSWNTTEFTPSISVSPSVTTTYTVTITDVNSCEAINSVNVNVNPLPSVNAGSNVDICIGESTVLTATGNSNTYLWNTGETTASITVSPGLNATYTVAGTITATGCSETSSVDVTVNALPSVSFTIDGKAHTALNLDFCENGIPVSLIGTADAVTPAPGVFTGTGGVTGSQFDPSVGANTYFITYTHTDVNGCVSAVTSNTVTVNPAPVVTIDGLAVSYCKDILSVNITGNPTIGLAAVPGTFTFPATWGAPDYLDNIDGTAVLYPANIDPTGGFDITYAVTDLNGCAGTITQNVNINPLPTVDFNGLPANICANGTAVSLTGSPIGATGVFTGNGLINPGVGIIDFDPNGLAVTTHDITYIYTDPVTGCVNDVIKPVNLWALPDNTFSVTTPGGIEYCSNTSGITIGVSNSQDNTHDYSLVQSPGTIMETLAGTGAAFSFAGAYPAANYTVIVENSNLCQVQLAGTITPVEVPQVDDAGAISGDAIVCANGTTVHTYTVPAIANAASYVWVRPAGVTLVADLGTSITVTFDLAFAGGDISVYGVSGSGACANGLASSFTVTPFDKPTVNGGTTITGDDIVCEGETGVTYSINPIDFNFENAFEWQTTSGAIIGNNTGSSVIVDYAAGSVTGTLQVRAVNSCDSSIWVTLAITVNQEPDISINPTADLISCDPASRVILTANSTENPADIVGWNWTASNGGVIESTLANIATVERWGDYQVEIEVAPNAQSCFNTYSISVGADTVAPIATINPPDVITCDFPSVDIVSSANTASDFLWSTTETSSTISVNAIGTYSLTVTDQNNNCEGYASATVVANNTPPQISVIAVPNDTLNCIDNDVLISGNSTTANPTYVWTGPAVTTTPNNQITTANTPGIYTLTVEETTTGCTNFADVEVIQNIEVPTITSFISDGDDLTCSNPSVQLTANVATVPTATFTWATSGTGSLGAQSGTYNEFVEALTSGTYTVTSHHPLSKCTDQQSITVDSATTIPSVTISASNADIDCNNPTVTLTATDVNGDIDASSIVWSHTGVGNIVSGQGTMIIEVSVEDTYTITANHNITGCLASSTIAIGNTISYPIVTIPGSYEISCSDPDPELTATATAGSSLLWTGPGAIDNDNTLNPTVYSVGTYWLTATFPGNGCSASTSVYVSDNTSAPTILLDQNPNPITCDNNPATLTISSSSGIISSYLWEEVSGNGLITSATNGVSATVNDWGQFRLTVTSPNGCSDFDLVNVAIDTASPSITGLLPTDNETLTCNITEVTLDADPIPGAQFQWSTLTGGNITNDQSPTPTVDTPGLYTLEVTDPNNGCSRTASTTVPFNYAEPTTVDLIPTNGVLTCATGTILLDASGSSADAINFTWAATLGGNIVSNPSPNQAIANAAGRYTVTARHDVTGCPKSAQVDVTSAGGKPLIDLFTNFPDTLTCSITQVILMADATALATKSWAWSTTNGSFVDPLDINDIDVIVDGSGTYQVEITNTTTGCSSLKSFTVIQNITAPSITILTPDDLTCLTTEVTVTANATSFNNAPMSYAWGAGAGGNITSVNTSSSIIVDAAANYTVTVTDLNNNCPATENQNVGSNTTPPDVWVNETPGALTCNQSLVQLVGGSSFNVDYHWTGLSGGFSSTLESPNASVAGTYNLEVNRTDNGCTTTSNDVIITENRTTPSVIMNAPSGDITCTSTDVTVSTTYNADYLYQWTGPGTIESPGLFSTIVHEVGLYTVIVTDNINKCDTTIAVAVASDFNPSNIPVINDISSCFGQVNPDFVVISGDNVKWYTDNTLSVVAGTGNTFSPTSATTVGIHNYYATSTGTNGCESLANEVSITIHGLPNVPGAIDNEICEGAAGEPISAVGNYIRWYDSGNVFLLQAGSYTPLDVAAGSYNYYATQTGANNCESNPTAVTYTITPVPLAPVFVDNSLEVCEADVNPPFTISGQNINWYKSIGGGIVSTENIFAPLDIVPGTYTYYATQTISGCESTEETGTITIYDLPSNQIFTGGGNYCEGSGGISIGLVYSELNVNYELWLDETSLVIDDIGVDGSLDFGNQLSAGSYTVYAYSGLTTCRVKMSGGVDIAINPLPDEPGSISGDNIICQSQTGLVYSIIPIANADSYVWTVPAGFNIISGDNSNAITVSTDLTASDGNISVYSVNGCGNSESSPANFITVNNMPESAQNLTGPPAICLNQDGVVFTVDVIPFATQYIWDVPVGGTIVAGQNTRQIVIDFNNSAVNDDITVYGTNDCGDGSSATISFIVNSLPTVSAGDDQNLCDNQTALEGNTPPGGSFGDWGLYEGAASVANINQYNSNIILIGRGKNILVWKITNSNGCENTDTVNIFNNTIYVDAGSDQIICSKTTSLQAFEPLTGGVWKVLSGSGFFADPGSSSTTVTGLSQNDNVFIWEFINNGCISSDQVKITNDLPQIPNGGVDQVIPSAQANMDASQPEAGTVGTWSIVSGSGTFDFPINRDAIVSGLTPGVNLLAWTVQRNACTLTDTVKVENTLIEDPEAGSNQIICTSQTTLDAVLPDIGIGEWSIISGAAEIADIYNHQTQIINIGHGENWLRWEVRTSVNSVNSDSVLIINNEATQANAGPDVEICDNTFTLNANTPLYGTGIWSLSSGSCTIDDDINPNSLITDLGQGVNEFKWTVTNENCATESSVSITNNTPTTAIAGDDQTVCFDSALLLPNTPSIGIGSWSLVSGAGTFTGNIVNKIAPVLNTYRYTITEGNCTSSDDINIISNKPTTPDAGYDKIICVDNITLDANQVLQGVGLWSIISGSGSFDNLSLNTPNISNISDGQNIYRWTISKNACVEHDEVEIWNNYIEAAAGNDIELCSNDYQLQASNPTPGVGSWSIIGASGAIFANQNSPNTLITNLSNGTNQLRWTIQNDGCETFDDVVITNNNPTDAVAGENQSVCSKDAELNANTVSYGVGTWLVMSGSGTFDDPNNPNTSIRNLGVGQNTLRWTINEQNCNSYDELIVISNLAENVFAGNDQIACSDTAVLEALQPTIGNGQWSIIRGAGNFDNSAENKTIIRNLGKGENVLKWMVSSSDCHVIDTVIITSNVPTQAIAGGDKILCSSETVMAGNTPTVGTGEWILVSGSAVIESTNNPKSVVSSIQLGTTILHWTINQNGCYSADEVVLTNNQPSTPFAGYDTEICEDSIRLFAEPPTIGVGQWTLVSGDAVIITPNSNQTRVVNIKFNDNTFRWTITNQNCVLYDDVVITSNLEYVNAGEDRQVNTPTVQLIGNKPAQGTGEWRVSASPATIETPGNFETMVSRLGSGANVFTWTITNNGCTASDDVVINYIVMPIADFDPSDDKGCPPMLVNFVNTSIGGAPYTWDFGDGETSSEPNVMHVYNEAGVYKAILTATAPLGLTVTKDTFITVFENPIADFDIAPKTIYIPGEYISCYNYSTKTETSQWFFGDGNYITDYAPTYEYQEEGIYSITLKAISSEGCVDSITINDAVEVLPRSNFFYPGGFTPNPGGGSDGIYDPEDRSNDVFYPIITNGELIEYEMLVYNRSGVLIFQTTDVNIGWDGYYRNKMQPQDVYIYLVRGKYNNGQPFKKTGNVLLIVKDN